MSAEHPFCYFEPAQGIRKSQEVLGPLQRCHETGHFGQEFQFVAVTNSVHTGFFSLPPWESKWNSSLSSLSRNGMAWKAVPCMTGCPWMKPLWLFHSAPPALVENVADTQEVGGKPTTSSFCSHSFALWALVRNVSLPPSLPEVALSLFTGRFYASLLPFLHLKELTLKLHFSNVWMPMPFNLWKLQHILLCSFKSGSVQVLYSHV